MDISKLETRPLHDKGAEMRVVGPDGKKTDFYITLAGVDSKLWEDTKLNIERSSLEGKKISPSAALSNITLSWRGLTSGKQAIEFNVDAAEKLYDNAPYICDQVDRFIAQRRNFLKPTQKK